MKDLVGHDALRKEKGIHGFLRERRSLVISPNEMRNTRNKFEETGKI